MTVELFREIRTGRTVAYFVVTGDWISREVSVVGPFKSTPSE